MNAFEQRMAQAIECRITGPLTHQLAPFQRLQEKLRTFRWRREVGEIDQPEYATACLRMNLEFEDVAVFLARYRSNVERFVSLRRIVDQLPAAAATACRRTMNSLESCFEEAGRAKVVTADPSFHVRPERLLEAAEEAVSAQTPGRTRPLSPAAPSSPEEDEGQTRAEVLRGLLAVEDSLQGKLLTQAEWTELREDHKAVDDLLQQESLHEAYWRMLRMCGWATMMAGHHPVSPPTLSRYSPDKQNRFRKEALRINAFLRSELTPDKLTPSPQKPRASRSNARIAG